MKGEKDDEKTEKDDEKTEKESVKGGLAISVLHVSHPISLPGYRSRIPQYQFFLRKTKILSKGSTR